MILHTVNDVASILKLSRSKVYELVEQGNLAHHRFGGAIRISEEQLGEFLEETKRDRKEPHVRRRPRNIMRL